MLRNRTILVFALLFIAVLAGGYLLLRAPAKVVREAVRAEEGHEGSHVELSPEQIANANLKIETAGSAKIATLLPLNGVIGPNEERMSQIVPRFEGVVRAIHKRIGDPVRQGEPLITIESNDTLRGYDIVAPLDGTIIARSAALGEHAGNDKALFVIADLTTVWANFNVYRSDFNKLKANQTIRVGTGELAPDALIGTVTYISPIADADTQTTLVRAVLPNEAGSWRLGQFVAGKLVLDEQTVPVAVHDTALQTVEGQTVVFVQEEDRFEPRAITVGARDGQMAEIRSGLKAGDRYVATNSFIVKSELGKSSAEHSH